MTGVENTGTWSVCSSNDSFFQYLVIYEKKKKNKKKKKTKKKQQQQQHVTRTNADTKFTQRYFMRHL